MRVRRALAPLASRAPRCCQHPSPPALAGLRGPRWRAGSGRGCNHRGLATGSAAAPPELVRDFIHRALYDPERGYFATTPCLHTPIAPIPFHELRGKAEYTERLAELYAAEDEAWLTPVEIFAPWYSYAVARYILDDFRQRGEGRLRIVEGGGGLGTHARHVLDFLRDTGERQAPHASQHPTWPILDMGFGVCW